VSRDCAQFCAHHQTLLSATKGLQLVSVSAEALAAQGFDDIEMALCHKLLILRLCRTLSQRVEASIPSALTTSKQYSCGFQRFLIKRWNPHRCLVSVACKSPFGEPCCGAGVLVSSGDRRTAGPSAQCWMSCHEAHPSSRCRMRRDRHSCRRPPWYAHTEGLNLLCRGFLSVCRNDKPARPASLCPCTPHEPYV
jgi:hypothetical protein